MLKKSKLTLLFVLTCFATPVFADDYDEDVCSDEVAADIFEDCAYLKTRKAQKRCMTKAAKAIKPLHATIGSKFTSYISSAVKVMKEGQRSDPNFDAKVKTEGVCTSTTEIVKKIKNACCKQKYRNKRQNCLKTTRSLYKTAKDYLDDDVFRQLRRKIEKLLQAPTCGAGGEISNGCDVMRSLGGGFLHKYPSDHGNVALLLPSYDSASSCDYITTKGEKLFNLRYYYRANGNRQHWRPYSGGYCGDFRGNRPVYARCKIRGQYHCWSIWNPCTRVE